AHAAAADLLQDLVAVDAAEAAGLIGRVEDVGHLGNLHGRLGVGIGLEAFHDGAERDVVRRLFAKFAGAGPDVAVGGAVFEDALAVGAACEVGVQVGLLVGRQLVAEQGRPAVTPRAGVGNHMKVLSSRSAARRG